MTTQASTKLRLVRCPRCRQVLAELPELALYTCGGCGTILQAKNRRVENNRTELSSEEKDSITKNQQDNVSEEKDTRSSNADLDSPAKVESLPDKANIRCEDEHGFCSVELCEDTGVSKVPSNSPEATCPQSEDSLVEVKESLKHDDPLGQTSRRYHSKFHGENGEWTGSRTFSNEFSSSGELTHGAEVYASEAGEHAEEHDKSHLHQDNEMADGESQRVSQEGENFIDEVQHLPEQENDEKNQIHFTDQHGDFHGGNNHAGPNTSSGIVSDENDNISISAEQSIEGDDVAGGIPISRSSSTEKNINASITDSIVASQSPLNESLVSLYLTSPDDEHLDHFPGEGSRNFERVSSVDTLGSSHLADLSSELNFKHQSVAIYPTTRSYYAYDGSESSYDGTDDQICRHTSHPSRKSKDVDHNSATDMLRRDRFRVNDVVNSEPERNYWATSSSRRATKSSHGSPAESTETNRYASGNRMRLDRQGAVSRLQFTSRDSFAGHRTFGRSSYQHDLLPPRPGFNSSDKLSYSEPDNMDLLRTVCELKDQLNRMHFPKVTMNRRFLDGITDGKFTPFHYDQLAPERELYAGHPSGCSLRCNQEKGCVDRCNGCRLAFSGEAAHYSNQVSFSCLHCRPQDWHYSAQLPPRPMRRENGHCMVHADQNCCNISSSELSLRGCESKSGNQRKNEIKQLRLREKYHTAKRHVRPIAAGAPIVACYHCWELVQLPADFLLFKKRYHQLMCNACRKVLKFSLLKGTHIVPYLPDASAPPPSEADDYNDATSRRNLNPLSHPSSCQNAEPVSCSDDYGRSFCRSCSTEGFSDQLERKAYNRKMSSGSSNELIEDRKMKSILREPQNKNESSLKNDESVGPSSKMPKLRKATSEIEELPTSSNSPLHQLMGYSSPSQVLSK